jgi:hypothetical protein
MSSLFSLVKDRINFWLLLPGLILLCILSSMLWIDSDAFLSIQTLKNISKLPQPKITIILLLLFLAISACYLLLFLAYSKKPKIKDYDLINPPGFLKHKKTGKYYCQPCLVNKHIESELSVISEKEFQCRVCKEPYKIDYSVLICNSYLSIAQNNDPLFKTHDKAVKELILKKENGQQVNQGDG